MFDLARIIGARARNFTYAKFSLLFRGWSPSAEGHEVKKKKNEKKKGRLTQKERKRKKSGIADSFATLINFVAVSGSLSTTRSNC